MAEEVCTLSWTTVTPLRVAPAPAASPLLVWSPRQQVFTELGVETFRVLRPRGLTEATPWLDRLLLTTRGNGGTGRIATRGP